MVQMNIFSEFCKLMNFKYPVNIYAQAGKSEERSNVKDGIFVGDDTSEWEDFFRTFSQSDFHLRPFSLSEVGQKRDGFLYLDIEAEVLEIDSLPTPTCITKTQRGFHVYWKLKDFSGESEELMSICANLAKRVGGSDLQYPYKKSSCIRLPGSYDLRKKEPHLVTIIGGSGAEYSIDKFANF